MQAFRYLEALVADRNDDRNIDFTPGWEAESAENLRPQVCGLASRTLPGEPVRANLEIQTAESAVAESPQLVGDEFPVPQLGNGLYPAINEPKPSPPPRFRGRDLAGQTPERFDESAFAGTAESRCDGSSVFIMARFSSPATMCPMNSRLTTASSLTSLRTTGRGPRPVCTAHRACELANTILGFSVNGSSHAEIGPDAFASDSSVPEVLVWTARALCCTKTGRLGSGRGRASCGGTSAMCADWDIGSDQPVVRLLAFHLPQFHPIPENDRWWGKGFTEWTNVAKAEPLFRGHDQPRLPADLGYYDLRLPEARAAQAVLAKSYGIEGFCYWHYWFHGNRLLERPVEEILASGEPDFPFCLAWANESWSRSWLGDDREILIEQSYSEEDDRAHARHLLRAFSDPRYIRIHGRPMLVVYKPTALPDAQRTTDIFRHECTRSGLPEPYLVGIDAHCPGTDMRRLGFDMTEHHEPQLGVFGPEVFQDAPRLSRLKRNLRQGIPSSIFKVYSYVDSTRLMARLRPAFPHFPCCFAGWDNTARRGRHAIVIRGSTPELFGDQLALLAESVLHKDPQERVVFINAWNEWAEGMYLEPDVKFGHAYLRSVAQVLEDLRPQQELVGAGQHTQARCSLEGSSDGNEPRPEFETHASTGRLR